MKKIALIILTALIVSTCACADIKPGMQAHYYLSGAEKGQTPPVSQVWLIAKNAEIIGHRHLQWWQLIMKKQDGGIIAVQALSEQVPMTANSAPGAIERYMFNPEPGVALEYVDKSTGKALLPSFQFKQSFLPRSASDARYEGGFATSGTLLGQVLEKADDNSSFPVVDLSKVKTLVIRTDFIIGTVSDVKDDGNLATSPGWDWHFVQMTQDDYKAKIAAGFNYFGTNPRVRPWVENEATFFAGAPNYPDDFYRSNYDPKGMFLDEPMVILGWNGSLPASPTSPNQVAQALRSRVASQLAMHNRMFNIPTNTTGTLDLLQPKPPTWDTDSWAAWYELQAGASGVVHEGRYVHRGYGWEPENLVGQDVSDLTKTDQFNFFYAFMRGAARSFNGDWGTSLYGHSDISLRMPAFIRAYNMGAKYLWFWTTDHQHHMPFTEQIRIAKAITDYADKHPRPSRTKLLRQAEVGIALPPGYAFSCGGIWGTEREKLNSCGISYGDIAAAALWEGILCSRRGIEYDYLVDFPGITKLGYKRIIRIKEDGSLDVTPKWTENRAPKNLKLAAIKQSDKKMEDRMQAHPDYIIQRARKVTIDGDFSDWSNAMWIPLGGDKWYGDSVDFDSKISIPEDTKPATPFEWLGCKYVQMDDELKAKYYLETLPNESHMLVSSVQPGSPADHAGLKEGDILLELGGRKIQYPMHMCQQSEYLIAENAREAKLVIRRSGRSRYEGATDLSAVTAFMVDDNNLYFAAKVEDDTHIQDQKGWDLWKQDCVQIGFDSILDRNKIDYSENCHEIGFALSNGKPVVWRWRGRRGQAIGEMKNVKANITRNNGSTYYEAAIPIKDLEPFTPDFSSSIKALCGIDIVINDSDTETMRKGRVELTEGAMTHGKNPSEFAVFECAPSANQKKISANLQWNKRSMRVHSAAELTLGISSPTTRKAIVHAELISLDTPDTKPEIKIIKVPVTPDHQTYKLNISSDSPAGRYKLKVSVKSESGQLAAEDALNVYIYP